MSANHTKALLIALLILAASLVAYTMLWPDKAHTPEQTPSEAEQAAPQEAAPVANASSAQPAEEVAPASGEKAAPETKKETATWEPHPSEWRLRGILHGDQPAALVDTEGRTEVFEEGEVHMNWELVAIRPAEVEWRRDAETYVANLPRHAQGNLRQPTPDNGNSGQGAPESSGDSQPSDLAPPASEPESLGIVQVLMPQVRPLLLTPRALLGVAPPIQHFSDGQPVGMELTPLPPPSLLYRLGLQPGDVVTAINGHPTLSLPDLGRNVQDLAGEDAAVIDLLRAGEPARLIVEFIRQR